MTPLIQPVNLIIGGNQTYSRIKFGSYNSGRGDVLLNKGNFNFERLPALKSGISITGDIRNAVVTGQQLIFGINDQQPVRYKLQQ